jgi:hypothetical protein
VDTHLHFGIRVTSPIEGCHAVLKAYLKVSTGDLKGVFDRLKSFWPDQHRHIQDSAAQEQNKVKHRLNKAYFHMVQSLVHDHALSLIVVECAKLHKAEENSQSLGLCRCTVTSSMGIPCFHKVSERLKGVGHILPEDIHPFWWYKRPEPGTTSTVAVQTSRTVLNPAVVRGKGRPRGAKGKHTKNHGITGMTSTFSPFNISRSNSSLLL